MKKFCLLLAVGICLMSGAVLAAYPDGTLLKEKNGISVYEIKNGRKTPVPDTSVIGRRQVIEVSPAEFSQIPGMPLDSYKSMGAQSYDAAQNGQAAKSYAPPQKAGTVVNTKSAQEVSMGSNSATNVTTSPINASITLQQLQQRIDKQQLQITQDETLKNNLSSDQSKIWGFLRNKTAEDNVQRSFELAKQLAIVAKKYADKGDIENGQKYLKESLAASSTGWVGLGEAYGSYVGNLDTASTITKATAGTAIAIVGAPIVAAAAATAATTAATAAITVATAAGASTEAIAATAIVTGNAAGVITGAVVATSLDSPSYVGDYIENGASYAAKEFGKNIGKNIIVGTITDGLSPSIKEVEGKVISSGPVLTTFSKGTERSVEHFIKKSASLVTEKGMEKSIKFVMDGGPTVPPLTSCGNSKSLRAALQINEVKQAIKGGFSFEAACEAHDACYDNCQQTKVECDSEFHKGMTAICAGTTNKSLCFEDRNVYYSAVNQYGKRGACTNMVNGSIVRVRGRKEVYLIQSNKKLFVPDLETLVANKLDLGKLVEVDASVLDGIQTGLPLHSARLVGTPTSGGQPSQNTGTAANIPTALPQITSHQGQQPPAQKAPMSGGATANMTAANDAWNDCARRLGPSLTQKLSAATSSRDELIRRQKEVFDELDRTCGKQIPDGVKQQILASMQNYVPPAQVAVVPTQQLGVQQNQTTVAAVPTTNMLTHAQPQTQSALQPVMQAVNPNQRVVAPVVATASVQPPLQVAVQPHALVQPPPANIRPNALLPVTVAQAQPISPQPQPQLQTSQKTPTPTSALQFNGFASNYSTTSTPYQPTISLSGSGFNSVTQIKWTCAMPNGASCGAMPPWTSSNWNGKFIRYSDTSAVVAPMLLVATDPKGTYHWTATFHGAGQPVVRSFAVAKN